MLSTSVRWSRLLAVLARLAAERFMQARNEIESKKALIEAKTKLRNEAQLQLDEEMRQKVSKEKLIRQCEYRATVKGNEDRNESKELIKQSAPELDDAALKIKITESIDAIKETNEQNESEITQMYLQHLESLGEDLEVRREEVRTLEKAVEASKGRRDTLKRLLSGTLQAKEDAKSGMQPTTSESSGLTEQWIKDSHDLGLEVGPLLKAIERMQSTHSENVEVMFKGVVEHHEKVIAQQELMEAQLLADLQEHQRRVTAVELDIETTKKHLETHTNARNPGGLESVPE